MNYGSGYWGLQQYLYHAGVDKRFLRSWRANLYLVKLAIPAWLIDLFVNTTSIDYAHPRS